MTSNNKPEGDRPLSPCILICTLDDNGVCLGCQRTMSEISRWALMTADEQWQLIADLAVRQATNDVTLPPLDGD